jgi:hypothetical protein
VHSRLHSCCRVTVWPGQSPRPILRGGDVITCVKSHILHEVTLFTQNTADLKEYNLQKSPIQRCVRPCLWDEWQWVKVINGAFRDTRRTPSCIVAFLGMGSLPGGRSSSPVLVEPKWMLKPYFSGKEELPRGSLQTGSYGGLQTRRTPRLGGFGRDNWAGIKLCEPRGSGRESRRSGFAEKQEKLVRGC